MLLIGFSGLDLCPYHRNSCPGPDRFLRPGSNGCFTVGKPVPLHAGHLCSVGFTDGYPFRRARQLGIANGIVDLYTHRGQAE
jgi:hypothetical protein